MPRTSRRVAESGYYHVMLRGNGKQVIFEDDRDRRAFLDCLARVLEESGLALIAWCLMSNHVHLLLSDAAGRLSGAMHALATRYAGYFNARTGRVGSVFAGRFKSMPVESDAQLVAAVRYIHQNPEKAGICPAAEYPWSSYHEYVRGGEGHEGSAVEKGVRAGSVAMDAQPGLAPTLPALADVSVVLDLVGGVEGFLEMSASERPNDYCFRPGARISDTDVLEVARAAVFPEDPRRLREASGAGRNRSLLALRNAGLTTRQIERVTGIGHYAVEKGILLARNG